MKFKCHNCGIEMQTEGFPYHSVQLTCSCGKVYETDWDESEDGPVAWLVTIEKIT